MSPLWCYATLSSSAQSTPHSTSCLDTFFPVPAWRTLSPPPGLYTFLGRPVLPILEYKGSLPQIWHSLLLLIILDILRICFLSVFSTEMLALWRQELGFAHCSTPSHDMQLLLKCLLNEWRNFFMGSFALAGHQCFSEERTLYESWWGTTNMKGYWEGNDCWFPLPWRNDSKGLQLSISFLRERTIK